MRNIPKFVKGLDPVADAFASSAVTDIISMKNHKTLTFMIHKGVSTSETDDGVVTVEACDDTTPSNTSAIEFRYQEIVSGDTPSEIKKATTSGFAMTPGSSQLYAIYVDASSLASLNYEYVRLKVTEDTDDPVVASITAMLSDGKVEKEITDTAIV